MKNNFRKIYFIIVVLIIIGFAYSCKTLQDDVPTGMEFSEGISVSYLDKDAVESIFSKNETKNPFATSTILKKSKYKVFALSFNFKEIEKILINKAVLLIGENSYLPANKMQIVDLWKEIHVDTSEQYIEKILNDSYLPFGEFEIQKGIKYLAFYNNEFTFDELTLNMVIFIGKNRVFKSLVFNMGGAQNSEDTEEQSENE